MAALQPAAAAAGTKRKEAPQGTSPQAAKEARGLDEEDEDDIGEIWMEPRQFCDWTIVVLLEGGFTLKARVHRVKLALASPRWWTEYIQEHMVDGEATTTFKQGTGSWKNRAELQLYLDTVYAYPKLTESMECFNTERSALIRLLHALDATQCVVQVPSKPDTGLFVDVSNVLKFEVTTYGNVSLALCVELAERYRWDWMHEHIADLLLNDAYGEEGPPAVWKSPKVAAVIAPLLLKRARLAEHRVDKAKVEIEDFRESFCGSKADNCDDDDCNHENDKCNVDHSSTSNSDYGEDALEALNNISDHLQFTWPKKKTKPAAAAS